MRVAALDLGSNTFLLLIAEVTDGRISKILCDETAVTRLGEGVHQTRVLSAAAIARAESSLYEFKKLIDRHQAQAVYAVATSAARDAKNKSDLESILSRHKIPLQIISGETEAKLTLKGALSDLCESTDHVVVDIGGLSTEFSVLRADGHMNTTSINIGSVRLTEMFFSEQPPKGSECERAKAHLDNLFKDLKTTFTPMKRLVAVAGTPAALSCLERKTTKEEEIHQSQLSLGAVNKWVNRLCELNIDERKKLVGMPRGREDVILAGALILQELMRALGVVEALVSIRGVRHGVALSWQDL